MAACEAGIQYLPVPRDICEGFGCGQWRITGHLLSFALPICPCQLLNDAHEHAPHSFSTHSYALNDNGVVLKVISSVEGHVTRKVM